VGKCSKTPRRAGRHRRWRSRHDENFVPGWRRRICSAPSGRCSLLHVSLKQPPTPQCKPQRPPPAIWAICVLSCRFGRLQSLWRIDLLCVQVSLGVEASATIPRFLLGVDADRATQSHHDVQVHYTTVRNNARTSCNPPESTLTPDISRFFRSFRTDFTLSLLSMQLGGKKETKKKIKRSCAGALAFFYQSYGVPTVMGRCVRYAWC